MKQKQTQQKQQKQKKQQYPKVLSASSIFQLFIGKGFSCTATNMAYLIGGAIGANKNISVDSFLNFYRLVTFRESDNITDYVDLELTSDGLIKAKWSIGETKWLNSQIEMVFHPLDVDFSIITKERSIDDVESTRKLNGTIRHTMMVDYLDHLVRSTHYL